MGSDLKNFSLMMNYLLEQAEKDLQFHDIYDDPDSKVLQPLRNIFNSMGITKWPHSRDLFLFVRESHYRPSFPQFENYSIISDGKTGTFKSLNLLPLVDFLFFLTEQKQGEILSFGDEDVNKTQISRQPKQPPQPEQPPQQPQQTNNSVSSSLTEQELRNLLTRLFGNK